MINTSEQPNLPNFSEAEVRRSSEILSRTSGGTIVEVRKFGAELPGVRTPEKFGARTSNSDHSPPRPREKKFAGLLEERHRLEKEIEVYERNLRAAQDAEEPYNRVVASAKTRLLIHYVTDHDRLTQTRYGTVADVMAAHDAYVHARHAWWPYGKPVQDLERALKEVRRQLRIVNTEIGI